MTESEMVDELMKTPANRDQRERLNNALNVFTIYGVISELNGQYEGRQDLFHDLHALISKAEQIIRSLDIASGRVEKEGQAG